MSAASVRSRGRRTSKRGEPRDSVPLAAVERPRVSRRVHLAVAVAYGALALLFSFPAMFHPLSVSYLGHDSLLFLWNFWWVKFALVDLVQSPFFCDYVFWPSGTSLALSSLALPYGLVSIPFQLVLGEMTGCLAATRLVTFVSLAASAWVCYALCSKLSGSRAGAFVAGILFAFVPYRMWQFHLLHAFCFEFLVLWVWALVETIERPTLARGGALGVCSALLLYASPEFALYGGLLGAIIVVSGFARREGRLRRIERLKALALAGGAVVLIGLPMTANVGVEEEAAARFDRQVEQNSPSLAAMLLPSPVHPLWGKPVGRLFQALGAKTGRAMRGDATLGYAAIALALVGLFAAPRRVRLVWGGAAALFFLLALGPELRLTGRLDAGVPMPYAFLRRAIPLFGQGRDTARFLPILMLCLAVLASFGVKKAMAMGPRPVPIAIACCALPVVEYLGFAQPVGPFPVPEFYRQIAADKEDYAILDLCPLEKAKLYWQIEHRKRIVCLTRDAIPRAPAQALAFVRDNVTLGVAIAYPQRLEALPSSERDGAIRTNRDLLRSARIRYAILHRRFPAVEWREGRSGLTQRELEIEWADSSERVLKLHGGEEAYRDADMVAYRFAP